MAVRGRFFVEEHTLSAGAEQCIGGGHGRDSDLDETGEDWREGAFAEGVEAARTSRSTLFSEYE